MHWNKLKEKDEVEQIITQSYQSPQLIFKHSTRCIISKMALKNFEQSFDIPDLACYYLDLITHRSVSDYIAQTFNIVHQSPQILVIKDGKCIYNASHEMIDAQQLRTLI